jgi:hypothetical protein
MTTESAVILEHLLRKHDLGWMIDLSEHREQALPALLEQLDRLSGEFRKRFGYDVSFTAEALQAEDERNPHKIAAFLQALGASGTLDMLLMVWRILQGLSIREVTMRYREQDTFSLSVTLARPEESPDQLESYHTDNIHDATLLRRFGIASVNGRPLFDGFFPLRKK